jgi:hypothetical protein
MHPSLFVLNWLGVTPALLVLWRVMCSVRPRLARSKNGEKGMQSPSLGVLFRVLFGAKLTMTFLHRGNLGRD